MATMPVNAQSLSPQSAAAVARAGSKESRVAWMMQAATKEGHSGIRSMSAGDEADAVVAFCRVLGSLHLAGCVAAHP